MIVEFTVVAAALDLEVGDHRRTSFDVTIHVEDIVVVGVDKSVFGIARQGDRPPAPGTGIVCLYERKLPGVRMHSTELENIAAKMIFP